MTAAIFAPWHHDSFWLVMIVLWILAIGLTIFVWIDSRRAERRLRKMREEADRKRGTNGDDDCPMSWL